MRFSLLSLLLLAGACPAADIRLLPEAAAPDGSLVRLGDVATITGRDADRLASLPLMPAPTAGDQQQVSAQAIREMLAAQGERPEAHRFAGAYFVRIGSAGSFAPLSSPAPVARVSREPTPTSRNPTAFRIRRGTSARQAVTQRPVRLTTTERKAIEQAAVAAVQAALDKHTNTDPSANRIAVRSVRLTDADPQSLRGSNNLVADWSMATRPTPGDFAVTLRQAGSADGTGAIADLVVQPLRVVAVAPISRGSLVTASLVRVEPTPLRELNRISAIGFSDLDQVIGHEARRAIRAGEVLNDSNTEPPLMVARGEEVTVSVGGDGISISARAIARQKGRHGELIPVELADTNERMMARVVGPRRLAILSAGAASPINLNGGLR